MEQRVLKTCRRQWSAFCCCYFSWPSRSRDPTCRSLFANCTPTYPSAVFPANLSPPAAVACPTSGGNTATRRTTWRGEMTRQEGRASSQRRGWLVLLHHRHQHLCRFCMHHRWSLPWSSSNSGDAILTLRTAGYSSTTVEESEQQRRCYANASYSRVLVPVVVSHQSMSSKNERLSSLTGAPERRELLRVNLGAETFKTHPQTQIGYR